MARPSSASNASRLATSTTLIPAAAICRANSLPIPDEAPVTSAQGPNLSLSSAARIFLLRSVCSGSCGRPPKLRLGGTSPLHPHAAADDDLLAGDPTRVVAREEHRGFGYIVRHAGAPQRC